MADAKNLKYTVHLSETRQDGGGRVNEKITAVEVDPEMTVQELVDSLLATYNFGPILNSARDSAEIPNDEDVTEEAPKYLGDDSKHLVIRATRPVSHSSFVQ